MNNATAGSSGSTTQLPGASVQEYSIKVPNDTKKKYHVMRYNGNLNIDFTKWSQVKLERENNMRDIRIEEEQPKFGAGSEFGREAKDEARRKKYGIISKKYKPEDQPWILKSGGKTGKKFRGVREGGVAENAAYYVFTHGPDGSIEAFPLNEWYNFQPIQRYKALSAEEAEEEFGRRNKVMNYFSLMLQKRLKNTEEGELEEEGELKKGTKKKGKKEKDLKISDMDEWMDSDVDESSDDEDGEKKKGDSDDENEKKKNKKKKEQAKKNQSKKKKKGSDESALEESDDGDEEGRELDYISDSSEDVSDHDEKARKEMSGVTEDKALRRLLNSDEEDDEDEEEEEEKKSDPEEEDKEEADTPTKEKKKKKKTKDKKGKAAKEGKESKDAKETGGEKEKNEESAPSSVSSDSSDDESKKKATSKSNSKPSTGEVSPPETNSNAKRAIAAVSSSQENPAKKARLDPINFNDSGISEEAVRRYLIRKPMTATELLQKFKRPKTNLSSEQLVTVMTSILKRINPTKQTIKNKMYLSLKPS